MCRKGRSGQAQRTRRTTSKRWSWASRTKDRPPTNRLSHIATSYVSTISGNPPENSFSSSSRLDSAVLVCPSCYFLDENGLRGVPIYTGYLGCILASQDCSRTGIDVRAQSRPRIVASRRHGPYPDILQSASKRIGHAARFVRASASRASTWTTSLLTASFSTQV